MAQKKKLSPAEQSARFREAAKKLGGDQRSFEDAFKKIVPTRKKQKAKS
jgi:hypothetical protein